MTEEYTPGYTQTASDFMAQRSAVSHAKFLLPHLNAASQLLDCGCGPGSISCDFAKIVVSGHVEGIDREQSQVDLARARASEQGLTNATFSVGSIYNLLFPDSSFNVVFAHAIFEHISSPENALAEMLRVLEPGGLVAIRSPDWGGLYRWTRNTRSSGCDQKLCRSSNRKWGRHPHRSQTSASVTNIWF